MKPLFRPSTETNTRSWSYGGFESALARTEAPAGEADLRTLLRHCDEAGVQMAFRGGGCSFDTQSIGPSVLVSLAHFDSIDVNCDAGTVTVGGGARWSAILSALEPHGLVLPFVVSTGYATAAGTLSANCLSRFSPVHGKEGDWVLSFRLMTVKGEILECSRERHADVFRAVIGGFGYFGAILGITYRTLRVAKEGPLRIETWVYKRRDIRELHRELVPTLSAAMAETQNKAPLAPGAAPRSVYSVLYITRSRIRSMISVARPAQGLPLEPMEPHKPYSPQRILVEWVLRAIPSFGQLFWGFAYNFYVNCSRPYVDPLRDYTFFMDGNVRAKRLLEWCGIRPRTLQQTYLIPESHGPRLEQFVQQVTHIARDSGFPVAMLDILFLPHDGYFLLSGTRNEGCYAISIALESVARGKLPQAKDMLARINALVLELRGRVHLVKHAFTRPGDIEAMYGDVLPEFLRIKRKLDPNGTITSAFFERLLPPSIRPEPSFSKTPSTLLGTPTVVIDSASLMN